MLCINCKGKALQILTAELGTKASNVIVSILYRAEFVISGHINTGCISETHRKKINLLLTTYMRGG
jgi:hypothetical protein